MWPEHATTALFVSTIACCALIYWSHHFGLALLPLDQRVQNQHRLVRGALVALPSGVQVIEAAAGRRLGMSPWEDVA
jgi:hypothetical protein